MPVKFSLRGAKRSAPLYSSPLYSSPWARLVENVDEVEGPLATPCWVGRDKNVCRFGYRRLCCYIPGLRGTASGPRRQLSAHVLAFAVHHLNALGLGTMATWDDVYLAYIELRESGDELDHECNTPACRNPAHLRLLSAEAHRRVTYKRAIERREVRAELLSVDEWEELEF